MTQIKKGAEKTNPIRKRHRRNKGVPCSASGLGMQARRDVKKPALLVNQVLQLFTGFKEWDLLGGHFHASAGLGVAAHARLALAGAEAAKAADLDLVAGAQRAHHAVEDGLHHHFAVFPGEFCDARYFFDQVSFRHDGLIYLASSLSANPLRTQELGGTTRARDVRAYIYFHKK